MLSDGQVALEHLQEVLRASNGLWEQAVKAEMPRTHVEVIRNYTSGLMDIQAAWEAERNRWQTP